MKEKIIRRTPLEVYELWIKALEHGEYVNTLNALKKVIDPVTAKPIIGFCCLGVVCDLAANDGGPQWNSNSADRSAESFMGQTSVFSGKMRQFLAISSNEISDIIGMNDDDRLSFKEIADYLDKILSRVVSSDSKSV